EVGEAGTGGRKDDAVGWGVAVHRLQLRAGETRAQPIDRGEDRFQDLPLGAGTLEIRGFDELGSALEGAEQRRYRRVDRPQKGKVFDRIVTQHGVKLHDQAGFDGSVRDVLGRDLRQL